MMPKAIVAISTNAEKQINRYFTSLPLNPQCLNFKANIGTSATSIHELRNMPMIIIRENHPYCSRIGPKPTISEPQNRALAGVGSPINDVV
jgi:hypothetical protein